MVEINNKFYISRNILATCFIKRKFFSTQPPNTKTKSFYSTSMQKLIGNPSHCSHQFEPKTLKL